MQSWIFFSFLHHVFQLRNIFKKVVGPSVLTSCVSVDCMQPEISKSGWCFWHLCLSIQDSTPTTVFNTLAGTCCEHVLDVGMCITEILWGIYICKAEKLSVRLSVTLVTHLGLLTSTYQLPNIIYPSSPYFKFVTTSECSDQIAFCSRLKMKK